MKMTKCATLSASACAVRNTSRPRAFRRAPPRKCEVKIHIRETQTGSCYSFRLQERPVAYADLREFVKRLEKEGELKRIRAEVDPVLEIAEVTQRVARDSKRAPNSVGPALLFEKPKGSRYPLLINAFGSVRRVALAFEVDKLVDGAELRQRVLKL